MLKNYPDNLYRISLFFPEHRASSRHPTRNVRARAAQKHIRHLYKYGDLLGYGVVCRLNGNTISYHNNGRVFKLKGASATGRVKCYWFPIK